MERAKASIIECLNDWTDTWYNNLVIDEYILTEWKYKVISKVDVKVRNTVKQNNL